MSFGGADVGRPSGVKVVVMMRPADWFAVGIRLLAVWILTQAVTYVVLFVDSSLGITPPPLREMATPGSYLFYAGTTTVVGLALLFGADLLSRLCYRGLEPDEFRRRMFEENEARRESLDHQDADDLP